MNVVPGRSPLSPLLLLALLVWPVVTTAQGTWTPTSTTAAPATRKMHTAVWTGSRMIVWGGAQSNSIYLNGHAYGGCALGAV